VKWKSAGGSLRRKCLGDLVDIWWYGGGGGMVWWWKNRIESKKE